MKLGLLEAENFMSINSSSMNFRDKGLVLVQGINDDSEAFESNGAGKSTLVSEAVVWVLFGETIRGQKADKVINRNAGKNTSVKLEVFDDNGDVYLIERYRKHKEHKNHVRLFRNGHNITGKSDKDTDQLIIDLLQMDFLTFTNSVMFGQGMTKMFASSTDSEQKKILETMLQIDIYRACQDLAKNYMKDVDKKRNNLSQSMALKENQIRTSESTIEHMQEKEANLAKEVDDKIQKLEEEWAGYNSELQMLPDIMTLEEEGNGYKALIKKLDAKIETYKQHEDTLNDLISDKKSLQKDMARHSKEQDTKRAELADIQAGKNIPKICKACGQDLPLKDTTHIENHIKDAMTEIQCQLIECKADLDSTEALIQKVYKLLEGKKPLEEQRTQLADLVKDTENEVVRTVRREKEIEKIQTSLLNQVEEQKKLLTTTYADTINHLVGAVAELKESLAEENKQMTKLDTEYSHYEFWANSYGNQGIKSVLLDSVTPFLNKRANYYLNRLADSSIEVEFTTQQELKSGEKKDKFSVAVTNHNGDDDYKGNSGGEKRRIDVSVNMSLQDLVLSRSNKRLDLIVYDEVFEGLDAVGSEAVIELLQEKAKEVGTIMIITHNDSLKQLFTKSMIIRKENGRTIVEDDES